MATEISMDTGMSTDPNVRQVIQSPANTMAERADAQSCYRDGESAHRLPAAERSMQRSLASPVIMASVRIKSARSGRSRR